MSLSTKEAATTVRASAGDAFLEALGARDFERVATTLGPDIRFRALLPRGPMQWQGAQQVAEVFRGWFGDADDFEVIDATVGEIGGRLHIAWRIRVRPAPFGIGDGWHVIEQQGYADGTDAIQTLDLLCSGFRTDDAQP